MRASKHPARKSEGMSGGASVKMSGRTRKKPASVLKKAVRTASKAAVVYATIKKSGGPGPAVLRKVQDRIRSVPPKQWVCLGGGLLAVDQTAKLSVRRNLKPGESICYGPLIIRNSPNRGAAFRCGEDYAEEIRLISAAVTAALGTALGFTACDEKYRAYVLPLSLLFHGSVSNVTDRLNFNEVTDYISFRVKNKKGQAMTFNLGDFAIFAGTAGLIGVWTVKNK